MRITHDIADAVLVEKTPEKKLPLRPFFVDFDNGLMPGFMAHLSFHRWYHPVLTFQFWTWAVTFFSPYPTIKFV